MTDLHIVPVGDLVEHDTNVGSECACGPTDTPIKSDEGVIRFMAVHHSLDGRERPRAETQMVVLLDEPDTSSEG